MSEIGSLLDRWFEWHVHFGTQVARTWAPQPISEAALAKAQRKVGGPAWPDELLDMYRWSEGGYHYLLPWGTVAAAHSVSAADSYYSLNGDGEVESENPYPILISPEYPCVHVDRAGPKAGKVWANDVGDYFDTADSLTEYLEAIVYMADKNMINPAESERTLTFWDHDSRWGPPRVKS